jgi:hypothetical protein
VNEAIFLNLDFIWNRFEYTVTTSRNTW